MNSSTLTVVLCTGFCLLVVVLLFMRCEYAENQHFEHELSNFVESERRLAECIEQGSCHVKGPFIPVAAWSKSSGVPFAQWVETQNEES